VRVHSLSRLRERAGVRAMRGEPVNDGLQNGISLGQRLAIVEAQDRKAELPQSLCSQLIGVNSIRFEVLATIQLDDQAGFNASEVGEEGPGGVLSAELQSAELAIAQPLPDRPFGIR
jgi:hypothetical protein